MSHLETVRPQPSTTGEGLVDLLDRVVARGVVVSGDVLVCLAGVELLRLDLRLLLASVDTLAAGAVRAVTGEERDR